MKKLTIEYQSPFALQENERNANRHPASQIDKLAQSINSVGFVVPVLVDRDNVLVVGHGRIEAAKKLNLAEVPTVRVEHLSEAQKRTLMIADNKLAELSVWDTQQLAWELEDLLQLDYVLEITDTGFDLPEVDLLIEAAHKPTENISADELIPSTAERVARRGDLWLLGKHLLFCGDALDPRSYEILLNAEKAQVVFTDPPYNRRVRGGISGKGKVRHREFVQASGEMPSDEFAGFLRLACSLISKACLDGAVNFICMDWRGIAQLISAAELAYSELLNLCCWAKGHGGMGSLYRSEHELVCVFKAGSGKHINNIALGKYGRTRTNVWSYPGMNSFQRGRDEKLAMHPTVKPVALVADALLDCSHRGGLVLDPFGGSGTTLIAAERTGRRAAVIELDPLYVDVTLRRFCDVTGVEPVNLWTGEIVRRRCGPQAEPPAQRQRETNDARG